MAAAGKCTLVGWLGLLIAMGPACLQAAPPQPAAPASVRMTSQQLSMMLVNSAYPFQREWAANELAKLDWHANPDAVHVLMVAAQRDAAPTVRAASIRALACMKCDTTPVVSVVQLSRNDTDPRVQHAAEVALLQFKARPAEMSNAGIAQVMYTPMTSGGGIQQATYVPAPPAPSRLQPVQYIPNESKAPAPQPRSMLQQANYVPMEPASK